MRIVKQAGAITIRERDGHLEALIVRSNREPSHWIFPKGHIEEGEAAAETARRELAEEAGVSASIARPIGVSTFQSGLLQVEVTYYLARFVHLVPRLDSREIRWLPIDDARRTLTFDDARRLLDDAVRELKRV